MTDRIIDAVQQVISVIHNHWQAIVNFLTRGDARSLKPPKLVRIKKTKSHKRID